jgi:hypothetical protein
MVYHLLWIEFSARFENPIKFNTGQVSLPWLIDENHQVKDKYSNNFA